MVNDKTFSLGTLMVFIGLVALVMAVAVRWWELGVGLALLLFPAWLLEQRKTHLERLRNEPPSRVRRIESFVVAFLATGAILVVGGLTFYFSSMFGCIIFWLVTRRAAWTSVIGAYSVVSVLFFMSGLLAFFVMLRMYLLLWRVDSPLKRELTSEEKVRNPLGNHSPS